MDVDRPQPKIREDEAKAPPSKKRKFSARPSHHYGGEESTSDDEARPSASIHDCMIESGLHIACDCLVVSDATALEVFIRMHGFVFNSGTMDPIGYVIPSQTGSFGLYSCDHSTVDEDGRCICDHSANSSCKRLATVFDDWWRKTGIKYSDPSVSLSSSTPISSLRLPPLIDIFVRGRAHSNPNTSGGSTNRNDVDRHEPNLTVDAIMNSIYQYCPDLRGHFMADFIRTQLHLAAIKDKHSFRWPDRILAMAHSVLASGGPKSLNCMRGIPSEPDDDHHLPNDLSKIALYWPDPTTVRNSLPPTVPGCHSKFQLANQVHVGIENAFTNPSVRSKPDVDPESRKYGIISCDEIDISPAICLLKWLNLVVGVIGDSTPVSEIFKVLPKDSSDEVIRLKLGTKICMFFYTSCNGWGVYPLHYIVTNSINATTLYKEVTELTEALFKFGQIVIATSTDGNPVVESFVSMMEATFGSWVQIYDNLHTVKLIRNSLRERMLKLGEPSSASFSMQTLRDLLALKGPIGDRFRSVLSTSVVDPSDMMAMKPVESLWNLDLLAELKRYADDDSPLEAGQPGRDSVHALHNYLSMMHRYYNAFNTSRSSSKSSDSRLTDLASVTTYLITSHYGMSVTINLEQVVSRTLSGMELLHEGHLKQPKKLPSPSSWIASYLSVRESSWPEVCLFMRNGTFMWSGFSTLPDEHFFSIIRGLCPILTAGDFGWTYVHACTEYYDMLTSPEVQPFSRRPVPNSSTYPQRSGLVFNVPRKRYTKKLRKLEIAAVSDANQGDEDELHWCEELATRFKRSPYTATIRQSLKLPFDTPMAQPQGHSYQCALCIGHHGLSKAWKTQKTLVNHFNAVHSLAIDPAQSFDLCFKEADLRAGNLPYVAVLPVLKQAAQVRNTQLVSPALISSPSSLRSFNTPTTSSNNIIFDIEHTGGRIQDLTNLSAWNISDDPKGGYRFNALIRPNHPPVCKVVQLNNLTMDKLMQFSKWEEEASTSFLAWLNSFGGGRCTFNMISHNGATDMPILQRHIGYMHLADDVAPKMRFFDSMRVFAVLRKDNLATFDKWPVTLKRKQPAYNLEAISNYLLPNTLDGQQTHLAFDDVTLLVRCLQTALSKAKGEAFNSVDALDRTCTEWQSSKKWSELHPLAKKAHAATSQMQVVTQLSC